MFKKIKTFVNDMYELYTGKTVQNMQKGMEEARKKMQEELDRRSKSTIDLCREAAAKAGSDNK